MCLKFSCFGFGHGNEDFGHSLPPSKHANGATRAPYYHQPPATDYGHQHHAHKADETGRKANNDVVTGRDHHHAAAAAAATRDVYGRAAHAPDQPLKPPHAAARNNKVADDPGHGARVHQRSAAAAADSQHAATDHHYYQTAAAAAAAVSATVRN
ncbi:hypothetical protein ABZP36_024984 [Zizania latifolia]